MGSADAQDGHRFESADERVLAHALSVYGHERTDAPAAALSMVVTDQLADNLALLFDKFAETEFIVCIEGVESEHGELQLRDFRMPHIAFSASTGTAVYPGGGCDQYEGVIGTLHSHLATYPEDRDREWTNCYLSRSDIVSWLDHSDYPYTFVMCGPRFIAWWHRSQVDPGQVLAFPPSGQISGQPPR